MATSVMTTDCTVGTGSPVEVLVILNWSPGKPLTAPACPPAQAAVPVVDSRVTPTPAVGVELRQDVEIVSHHAFVQ